MAGIEPIRIPKTMQFVDVAAPGGPEMLGVGTCAVPQPAAGEALIQVAAAGVNHADLLQRQGKYPPPPGISTILGLEVSGRIAAFAGGAEQLGRWRIGDPVCALLAGGGYAEYCTAPAGQLLPVPEGIPLVDSAALPEAAVTVWANLFLPRRIRKGSLLLVQGGSSGVGSMAIQMARSFGARVAATAGTEEKCEFAREMGAEKAVNYRNQDWETELAEWSRPRGIDAILDVVGGHYLAKHLRLLARDGQLVHIAALGGNHAEVDLRLVMSKRLVITGSTLRSRPVEEKSLLLSSLESETWPLFATRRIRPVISSIMPLASAAEAHRLLEAGVHKGKILLTMNSGHSDSETLDSESRADCRTAR